MKRLLLVLVMAGLVAGCGSDNQTSKFQGTSQKKDFIGLGMKLLAEKDIPKAIQAFDEAIKQEPQNPQNYIILAQVYMQLKNIPRAVDSLTAALRVAPENGEAHYLMAVNKALMGSRDEAVGHAQRSADLHMQNRNEESFKKSLGLVRSLMEAGQADKIKEATAVNDQLNKVVSKSDLE